MAITLKERDTSSRKRLIWAADMTGLNVSHETRNRKAIKYQKK